MLSHYDFRLLWTAAHPSQYFSHKREESIRVIVEPTLSMLRQQEIHLGYCWAGPFNVGTTSFQKNLETKLPKKLSGKLGLNIEGPRPTITRNHNGSTLKGRGPQEPKIVTAVWIISSGLDRITSHQSPKWILVVSTLKGPVQQSPKWILRVCMNNIDSGSSQNWHQEIFGFRQFARILQSILWVKLKRTPRAL